MPTFTYQAKDLSGKDVNGIIEAGDARGASNALREQGLFTLSLVPAKNARPANVSLAGAAPGGVSLNGSPNYTPVAPQPLRVHIAPFLAEVPLGDLALMYRQMATLFAAGVPMVQALGTLAAQSTAGRLKTILKEGANTVAGGNPFSSVMDQHPHVFSQIQVELIRAGETGGMIETMCDRLASYLEREIETRSKLKRETLYPKIVLFVAGLVILILSFVGAGMGKKGGDAVVSRVALAVTVAVVGFGVWWAWRFLNQFPPLAAAWDYIKLLIPGPGGVARKYATARFARAMGALYAGGINLIRAVEIGAKACGNRAIGDTLIAKIPMLMSGGGLSGMLEASGLLSPIAVQMARTGEQTGSLDTMMEKVADYLESEADAKAHQMAVMTGVATLLVAAIVVAIIVISFYGGYISSLMHDAGGGEGGGG